MGWQPIETAPVGEAVELGWWDTGWTADPSGNLNLRWERGPGVVKKRLFSQRKTGVEFGRGYATHWRPLPEPPEDTQ